VPLIIADCLLAQRDWLSILTLVDKPDWGENDFYRLAVAALAQRMLGQSSASDLSWRKAMRHSSRHLDRLARLGNVTGHRRWDKERIAVLQDIVGTFPKENWALEQLVAALYSEGNTAALEQLFLKVLAANPSDNRYKNNLASLYLLRKTDVNKAHRLAKE